LACTRGYDSYVKTASVSTVKNRLSAYLDLVRQGEVVVITDRGQPIARLVPLESSPAHDTEAWRRDLEGRGAIKRSAEAASAALLDDLPPAPETAGDALAALLEERAEGR
jgi:prevent-host-death family protein